MSNLDVSLQAPAMDAKDGFMPSENVPVTQSDINAFEHEAPVVVREVDSASDQVTFDQASLTNALQRWVKVGSMTIQSADILNTRQVLPDVWTSFLANPFVADKVKNFRMIRSSLHLTAVVTVPAGTFGLYGIMARPRSGIETGTPAMEASLQYPGYSQLDHFAIVNVANANTFEFVLPFIWPEDYAQIDLTLNDMYEVELLCYHGLTATNGSATPTGTIQFYARCGEDVELIVPTYA